MGDNIKRVIDIDFNVESGLKNMSRLQKEIITLKETQKLLKKEGKESSIEYQKNAVQLKSLSKNYRTLEKVTQANINARKSESGSVNELKFALEVVTSKYNKLSANERENTEVGKNLGKSKKDLTDKLKKLEAATSDHRRNVGNYNEAIKSAIISTRAHSKEATDAIGQTGLFTNQIGLLTRAQRGLVGVLKIVKLGFVSLRGAIISTGIGALLIALGSLISYFTSTQRGIDTLNRYMKGFGAIVDVLVDRASALGETLWEAISNPKEAIKSIGEAIKTNFINRINGVGKMFISLKDVASASLTILEQKIKGVFGMDDENKLEQAMEDLKTSSKELGENFLQGATGIENIGEKLSNLGDTAKDIFKEASEEAGKAYEIEERMQKLRDREIQAAVDISERNVEIARARRLANDETVKAEVRMQAIKRAMDLENENLALSINLQKEKVTLVAAQNALGESLAEDIKRESDERVKLNQLIISSENKQKQLLSDVKRLQGEINKEKKSQEGLENEEIQRLEYQFEVEKLLYQEQRNDRLIDEQEFNDSLLLLQLQFQSDKLNLLREGSSEYIAVKQEIADMEYNIEEQRNDRTLKSQQRTNKAIKQLELTKLTFYAQTVGGVKTLLSQDEQARKKYGNALKLLSVAEIAINLQKQLVSIGTYSEANPLNVPTAGAAGAAIIAYRKAIAITRAAISTGTVLAQKFERGGNIYGPSHSNGGVPIEAEGGEVIINKRSAALFPEALNFINTYKGYGDPLAGARGRDYAERGTLVDGGLTSKRNSIAPAPIIEFPEIFVRVSDINKVNGAIAKADSRRSV